jgi:2-oxo-3-(phosphooxy)propyl 3-oxoalkanoate synthase
MSVSMLPVAPLTADSARTRLTFDSTVPRQLVHRASVNEVFLTDCIPVDADRFLVGAQLPRHHALYQPDAAGRCDFMLLAETVRQAGIFLIHRFHDVPLGHHFVFRSLDLSIGDLAALRTGATPLGIVLDISVRPAGKPDGHRFDARLDVTIEVDGRPCAYGSVAVLVVGARRYAMLRERNRSALPALTVPASAPSPKPSTTPVVAGRHHADVLLRTPADGTPATWLLHVDTGHPGYFEHPSDHVPGMVLLEAFRQAGHLAVTHDAVLTSLCAGFESFGELDQPVTVSVSRRAPDAMHLTAVQGGRTLARADARFERA